MGAGRRTRALLAALVAAVLVAGVAVAVAAGDDGGPGDRRAAAATGATGGRSGRRPATAGAAHPSAPSTSTTAAPATTTTAPPTTAAGPPVPPAVAPVLAGEPPTPAGDPVALAEQIVQVETAIRDPATSPEVLEAAARLQQLAYRRLGERPEWEPVVLDRAPPGLREAIWRHATARREFRAMHTRLSENLPAWRIVDPLPAEELLARYAEAEARFGVPWHVLAAVHLVETAMGRIVGLSAAGAQGPMQFMPATWEAYGMGGDVWDTRDAILGAANYLAANGGAAGTPEGLENALFHYNRSHHYVRGVLHYSAIMAAEPRAFLGLHAWPVVYLTVHGDVVLPTGYEQHQPVKAATWIAEHGAVPAGTPS